MRSLSDVLDRVEALEEFERTRPAAIRPSGTLHRGAARFVLRARDQLRALAAPGDETPTTIAANRVAPDEALLRSLLAAFPDRLARRREPGGRRGVMVGGRGVRLAPTSGVTEPELFLCVDVDAGQTESLVRQASAVQRDWLPPERVQDGRRGRVRRRHGAGRRPGGACASRTWCWRKRQAALPDGEETARVLAAAAAERLERVLPPDDSPAGLYRTRVRCLREWMPELELPAFDDADLRELLPWLCLGRRSFAELRARRLAGGVAGPADARPAAGGRARGAGAAGGAERQPHRAAV